ncbi:MAG: hypothetical protein IAE78_04480 [Myxococcus sp.]|nr:hypothetical protein [Myxococcus sp.]
MLRALAVSSFVLVLTSACGSRPKPMIVEDDAGIVMEVPDAGRQRGMDPPSGFSTAVEIPPDGGTRFGVSVSAAGDQFNQPLIAAVWDDPNGDGIRADTRVFFTRWNGEKKEYEPIKTIEVVGEIDLTPPLRQVAIARDPTTGRIGIAYVKAGAGVRFAYSDDEGGNFSLATVGMDPGAGDSSFPQVALRNGVAHVAFLTSTGQVLYRTRTGNTGAFTEAAAPITAGQASAMGSISLALDADGNPGLAYFTIGASLRATLAFWRPSTTIATAVTSSDMTDVLMPADRKPSVSLVFVGTTPRLAFHLLRADPVAMGMMTDQNPELWTAVATDATGTAWSMPVGVPRNGDFQTMRFNTTQWYQGLVVHPNGSLTIGGAFLSRGTVNTLCAGGPKLARSDTGDTFMTCSPMNTPLNFAGEWLTMWGHAPNKVTVVFFYDRRANEQVRGGVTVYREP